MVNVYDTANKLAAEMRQTDEYLEYKKVKEELKSLPDVQEKIKKFEEARRDMQKLMLKGGTPVEEKAKEIQDLYADLIQSETAQKYFDLEVRFSVMVTDINKIISESIKDVIM